jgi:hypothetical protein
MRITFRGGEADSHGIDLYEGSESISGIGRAANLVSHYVITGDVRFRAPYTNRIKYLLTGAEEGSLTILVSEVIRLKKGADAAAAKLRSSTLLRHVIRRATGQEDHGSLQLADEEVPAGDIDVLAEAITPALQRAHRWIDQKEKTVDIILDEIKSTEFNIKTKKYLENEEHDKIDDIQDVSVGALNVNSRNGRVFFQDLGRTVPFVVPKNATDRTIPTLSRYLTQYAERTGATVNIRFRRVKYMDGRLKRIIVSDCYAIAGRH